VQFYLLDGCCHSAGVPNAGELTQKLTRRCGFGAAISGNFSVLCIAENTGNTRAATLPDMRGMNTLEAAPSHGHALAVHNQPLKEISVSCTEPGG
jgi:hypothetical protein